jgi:glutamate racemase
MKYYFKEGRFINLPFLEEIDIMIDKRPIGVFDSGVGGLTVLKELMRQLPQENLIYFGDNKRAPYGNRETGEVLEFCGHIAEFLKGLDIKLLVIACNTATVVCLENLQSTLDIPVIGVIIPGTKEALQLTKVKKIGVFSTPLTARSNTYKKEALKIDKDVEVYQVGCEPFCRMIESDWEDTVENQKIMKHYVDKMPEDIDVVVFGCTHYPIIKELFKRELIGKKWVNPARDTALEVKDKLLALNIANVEDTQGTISFYTSGNIEEFKKLSEKILGEPITEIKSALK